MICWTDSVCYLVTTRWFTLHDVHGTGTNWVSAASVDFQTTVGHC
jgi:hypothetical protein